MSHFLLSGGWLQGISRPFLKALMGVPSSSLALRVDLTHTHTHYAPPPPPPPTKKNKWRWYFARNFSSRSYGRRPLFLVSSITSTITLFGIGLSFMCQWSALPTLVILCLFMFCFSIGLGPLTFVVAAEVRKHLMLIADQGSPIFPAPHQGVR